jgi:hypothetical protein
MPAIPTIWEVEIQSVGGLSRPSLANNAPISANRKVDMVACNCHPRYRGSIDRRIILQACPGIKMRPYLKDS